MALPAHRQHELAYLCQHSAARALAVPGVLRGFDHQDMAAALLDSADTLEHVLVAAPDVAPRHHDLAALCAEPSSGVQPPEPPGPSDVAVFLLSGGTTGLPKLIARTHDDYAYNARASARLCRLDERTVYLVTLPAAHNFPPEQPSTEFAVGMINFKLNDSNAYGVVAERDGAILGSVFLTRFPPSPVAAIGPLTVHPSAEGKVGRQLMETALERAREQRFEGVRLVQSPSHIRSLALYMKLGFEVREPLLLMQGAPPDVPIDNRTVRLAQPSDLESCNELCLQVHGIQREHQLTGAIQQHVATVVEYAGRITGYASARRNLGRGRWLPD